MISGSSSYKVENTSSCVSSQNRNMFKHKYQTILVDWRSIIKEDTIKASYGAV